jgi:thiamine-monophosphate kinase
VKALATAGGCQAVLQRSALPLDPAMAALDQAVAWCLGGGEDFELVLALAPPWAADLVAALPGAVPLGVLRSSLGSEARLIWQDGIAVSPGETAYRHFQA